MPITSRPAGHRILACALTVTAALAATTARADDEAAATTPVTEVPATAPQPAFAIPQTAEAAAAAAAPIVPRAPAASTALAPAIGPTMMQLDALARSDAADRQARYRARHRDFGRLELAFQVLNAIDAAQTISFLERGTAYERNPLLGKNPSDVAVIGYKAAIGLGHLAVARLLRARDSEYRRAWQWGFIIGTGAAVGLNMRY